MEAINAASKMLSLHTEGLEVTMLVILVIAAIITTAIVIRRQKKHRGEYTPPLTLEQKKRKREREKRKKYERIAFNIRNSSEYQKMMSDIVQEEIPHIEELIRQKQKEN